MSTPKILAFAGSTREGSYNKKLAHAAAEAARAAGAETAFIDLRDLALPIFDEDLEAANGLPPGAAQFKTLLQEHDGFLIASPEYNSSITAVLKNALDWASRPASEDEPGLLAFTGKFAAIMSASPGALGGLRGLVHLRAILGNVGVTVLPGQVTVSKAYEAFSEAGLLKESSKSNQVDDLASALVQFVAKQKS